MRFAALGWRVEAVSPAGHSLRKTRAVARSHDYAALWPLDAVSRAIAAANPDLIVPCDDRAVAHLHALHARSDTAASPVARTIERSLGRPGSFAITDRRVELIRVAREEGLRAPDMRPAESVEELRAAVAEFGLPVVLKVDGSWGGAGVAVVHTPAEAECAWMGLARRLDMGRALKRLLVDRDPFYLLPWLARAAPRLSVQRFVRGRPATSVAACWQGEVLAGIEAEVLRVRDTLGSSSVVRTIARPDMAQASERLVRRLGLSGFLGFDFMIEDGTGHAQLIEMNPRSPQICHLALGPGRDPVAALAARIEGAPSPVAGPITCKPVIAFFPLTGSPAPGGNLLSDIYHDVPEDPDLVRELNRLPYPDRGVLARLLVACPRAIAFDFYLPRRSAGRESRHSIRRV